MRRFIKPSCDLPPYGSFELINLFQSGEINIRRVYRAYLAQCKAYSFYPSTFRQWYHLSQGAALHGRIKCRITMLEWQKQGSQYTASGYGKKSIRV